MEVKTTTFRIEGTDIIMYDYEEGKGKIIISNDDRDYNLSYYWGSMGQGYDLSKFIQKINSGYFVDKLGARSNEGPINMRKTMANVRKWIKEETSWKWYYNVEADKELREELNSIQNSVSDQNEFVHVMMRLNVYYTKSFCIHENDFNDMIEQLRCEPWHFIVLDEPHVNIWLAKFHKSLKKYLKSIN